MICLHEAQICSDMLGILSVSRPYQDPHLLYDTVLVKWSLITGGLLSSQDILRLSHRFSLLTLRLFMDSHCYSVGFILF